MKPVLTDEDIRSLMREVCPTFDNRYVEDAIIATERLTRERMMELVCGDCGQPNGRHECNGREVSWGGDAITRAEYLHREEER